MSHQASCCCEQLKLKYDGEITKSSICHCYACQKRTGSVFGTQVRLDKTKTTIEGKTVQYVRTGDSGGKITYSFCPSCGSTLFWEIDGIPGSLIAAVGTFDNVNIPAPTFSVYEARKHAWVNLPESIVDHMD